MSLSIKEILKQTDHRSWTCPKIPFSFYQEWNRALFFHWKVNAADLQELLPENLEIDLFNNEAYVSLVAFTMEKIRPRFLPPFAPVSNFEEINLRTYVIKDDIPGVYFLNIEAGKIISVAVAKLLSVLPYEHADMYRNNKDYYQSTFTKKKFSFSAKYEIGSEITDKTDLDGFLTERYCLYVDADKSLYRYDIHHLPWQLNQLNLYELETNYVLGNLDLNEQPLKVHYSPGVRVIAWDKIAV
ncbi:hypothetical protein SAMN02927937_01877 [Paenimyroides aquimaris]|uniref:DUF2071 domain-containing protein n=1 Tax=Paenimyroides marinum TaxID=1159016 RepID=A0A1H6LP73_9FLAO|nr:DUF2071 domain-containing protein [Paenimyroides aquimaris]SEH87232.1 hypothetical protein SAMN02927937_01877 [Paenimyroides aquimaris]